MAKTPTNTTRKAKVDSTNMHVRRKSGPVGAVVSLAEAMAQVVSESGALELRLDFQQPHLRLRRRRHAAPAPAAVVTTKATSLEEEGHEEDYLTPVTSLNVGVFRPLHPKTSKPLVSVGDTVDMNQCLGRVEAMGMLNDLLAPRAGTVVELLAEAGEPVEFGQVLILIQ